jgi:uncharacterized membrane protein SirB2
MEIYYLAIRHVHIGCVVASGLLFALRGALALAGKPAARHWSLRGLSWTIDTTLLTAALLLTTIVHQYPFVQGWLTAKVLLLVAYVALGLRALGALTPQRARAAYFAAALAVYALIIGIARAHDPLGWIRLLG